MGLGSTRCAPFKSRNSSIGVQRIGHVQTVLALGTDSQVEHSSASSRCRLQMEAVEVGPEKPLRDLNIGEVTAEIVAAPAGTVVVT